MSTDKFRNKYRIASARKPDWDYRLPAIYFVTICTQHRLHYFGNVENGKMILTKTGQIAANHWLNIPNHFPFIELINFVVMPNHVHGLLKIHDNDVDITSETLHATSLQHSVQNRIISEITDKNETMAKISPKRGSLSSVLRSYKSAVSKSAHECKFEFAWQPRFHDHIVKNADEFRRIYDYISDNPQNWKGD
jgi:REP element-mobilizing transposase RayT